MKQNQFLFVDIISALFLVIIFFGNFLGLLFISDGNTFISLVGSLVLVVCYYFLIKLLVAKKQDMVDAKFPHFSHLLWLFYAFFGLTTFGLTSHFINIEYNAKTKVQDEVKSKILLVESFPVLYDKRAKTDMSNYQVQIHNKSGANIAMATIAPMQIVVNQNSSSIKKTIDTENAKFRYVFNNWKWFSLMQSYNQLDAHIDSSLTTVNLKLKQLPIDKSGLSGVEFTKSSLPLNSPFELSKKFKPNYVIPIGIVLITHLFILMPFFFRQVVRRSTGQEPAGAILI